MQPFDYRQQVVNPFEQAIQGAARGFQLGTNIRAIQEQRQAALEKREAEMLAQQELQSAFADLDSTPNPTLQQVRNVVRRIPADQGRLFVDMYKTQSEQTQNTAKRLAAQLVSSLSSDLPGAPEIGRQMLLKTAESERNAGNEAQAKAYETYAQIIEKDPSLSKTMANQFLAYGTLTFGENWAKGIFDQQEAQRKQKLDPIEQRKLEAETKQAEARADNIAAELAKDLALTDAQIEQAKAARAASEAAARLSGAERQKKLAEAEQLSSGIIPQDKRPEAESKFRKEYSDQTKGYQEVEAAYGRVLASQPTAAGDIALIFNYMKMLDPGSVVREGEFATAQNAAGVPDRVINLYNKTVEGTRLNQDQRQMFTRQAEGLFKQAQTQERVVRNGITRIAKGYGLNTENIFYERERTIPQGPVEVRVGNRTFTFPNQESADAFRRRAEGSR